MSVLCTVVMRRLHKFFVGTRAAPRGKTNVICPYLRLGNNAPPDIAPFYTLYVFRTVSTLFQRGMWSWIMGGKLDIDQLDQIPIVSHSDLYCSWTRSMLSEFLRRFSDHDDTVAPQALVDLKLQIAGDSIPGFFSRGETLLLFFLAGGTGQRGTSM